MKEEVFVTNSFEETQKVGEEFAKRILLREGESLKKNLAEIIALYGDLGRGKTTFAQGMAKGLGIKRRIISPTFVIVREHRIRNHELGIMNFYHIDLYRIESEEHIKGLGLEEIMNDQKNIVVIEWAEKMERLLPEKRWDVRFEYLGEEERKITIKRLT